MFDLTNKNNDVFDCFTGLFNDAFAKELKTNIKEDEKSYYLEVETPGISKENINLSFNDDTLTIKIKKNEEKENKEETYLRKERVSMDMERSFYLENSNEDSIKAHMDSGILYITVDKVKKEPSKRVISID